MLNNKYVIKKIIKKNSSGNIYECEHNNKIFAVKEDCNSILIKNEVNIYLTLSKNSNITNVSKLYDYFIINNYYYIVLDCFSETMFNYKIRCYDSINYYNNIVNIIKKIITVIKYIHKLGIVHRDIKPLNICIDKNNEPYIIDFGLSKKIIDGNIHIKYRKINNIIGSNNFISNNIKNLIEPTRRDDMISIILTYIYMLLDSSDTVLFFKNDIENIDILLNYNNEYLVNNKKFIIDTYNYLNNLKFDQEPKYDVMLDVLFLS